MSSSEFSSKSSRVQLTWLPPLLLLVLFVVVVVKSAWLADDAYITLRTVNHWLDGFGPVWNIGERVQAYTHPLWMLLLSGVIGITREYYFTTILLSIVISAAAYALVVFRLAADWVSATLGGLILVLSKAYIDFSTSGLENALTHLLLAAFLVLYMAQAGRRRALANLGWLAFCAALGSVNRLDTLLLFLPPLAMALFEQRGRRWRALGVAALGFLPLVIWELFSIVYYGFPVPNTYYAKLGTGIALAAQLQQGLFYFMQSIGADPITMAAIVAGVALPWLVRDRRTQPISIAIILYLLYVLRIGGDFMSGRFLTAPLLCAVVILVVYPLAARPQLQIGTAFAAVLLLGFANPAQSPWLSNVTYRVAEIDNKGIADERGHYYQTYGLLPSNRNNRLTAGGEILGTPDPADFSHCGIGMRGFQASPYTRIVDFCGLADALIARLPALDATDWRIGHPIRKVPDGYLGTVRTGRNQIVDPGVAKFYDRLQVVIAGPLFAPERWAEIWRFNTGQYDGLLDSLKLARPDMPAVPVADFDRNWPEHLAYVQAHGEDVQRGITLADQGVIVDLGDVSHARFVDLQSAGDRFDVVYSNGNAEIGRQTVSAAALRLGTDVYTVVRVPDEIATRGYTQIRIDPLLPGENKLSRVALSYGALAASGGAGQHVVDLLRQYYFAYYRATGADRAQWLPALLAQLRARPAAEWADLPVPYRIDLLDVPDPDLQALVMEHLPEQIVLKDAGGNPKLRYLGFAPVAPDAGDQLSEIRAKLYFEVLAPFDTEYNLWFHIANSAGDGEYMIYDYKGLTPTTEWPMGLIYEVPIELTLDPGAYDVSFGFWTPQTRERLYADQANDVYWINLPQALKTTGTEVAKVTDG